MNQILEENFKLCCKINTIKLVRISTSSEYMSKIIVYQFKQVVTFFQNIEYINDYML